MNLTHLETFCSLVECRSFSAAAAELYITQPAVSHHVKALEGELGTPLLVRGRRFVTTTKAGAVLYRNAKVILRLVEQTEQEILDLQARGLTVATSPSCPAPVILDVLRKFAAARGLTLRMRVDEHDRALAGVIEASVDFSVVWYPGRLSRLTVRSLGYEDFCLVSAPGRTGGIPGQPQAPEVINGQPFILSRPGSVMRKLTIRWLGQAGIVPTPVLEAASAAEMRTAVEQGVGLAILPRHIAQIGTSTGTLDILNVPALTPLLARELCIVFADPQMTLMIDGAVEYLRRELGLHASPAQHREVPASVGPPWRQDGPAVTDRAAPDRSIEA